MQIYDRSIFPDVFGWTDAFFAGMPFPNFYPPLFYWLVAALHHIGTPLELAFASLIALPVWAIPVIVAVIAWSINQDRLTFLCSALASIWTLLDGRLAPQVSGGLTYSSTFNEGIYTHPLGFLFLAAWLCVQLRSHLIASTRLFVATSASLLALTVLTNFFAAIAAVPFLLASVVAAPRLNGNDRLRHILLIRSFLSIVMAVSLSAFWLFPVLLNYLYFATLPSHPSLSHSIPTMMWVWYEAAVLSGLWWFREEKESRTFVWGMVFLALVASSSAWPGLRAAPLQMPRFLSVFTLLCSVPIGRAVAELLRTLQKQVATKRIIRSRIALELLGLTCLLVFTAIALSPVALDSYLYSRPGAADLERVLDFAKTRDDGLYLVENPQRLADRDQTRALSSYLGAQGNEAATVVFRESSPSSLFFLPLQQSLSGVPSDFGISSALSSDLAFLSQPFSAHLSQAAELKIRYYVCLSADCRTRLRTVPSLNREQVGRWTIFEGPASTAHQAVPPNLPALVVSPVSFKERRSEEYSFTRFAEEQFASGWFDVPLVASPTEQLDHLADLDQFGSLIVDRYEYVSEDAAFQKIHDFAQHRSVLLLTSSSQLFRRLQDHLSEMPGAVVIGRPFKEKGAWMAGQTQSRVDQTSVHASWLQIQQILAQNRIPISGEGTDVQVVRMDRSVLVLFSKPPQQRIPVLVPISFHPSWRRSDGAPVYMASPSFMLTFANHDMAIRYRRNVWEILAGLISLSTIVAVLVLLVIDIQMRRRKTPKKYALAC